MYQPKLAIIYYSSTGTNHKIAQVIMKAAEHAGAEVRLRKVRELASESAIDQNPAWRAHHETAQPIIEATLEDLEWADAYIFGSPTRYGNIASQLKQFIDSTGSLWARGVLANKVVAGFTSAANDHGGQEATLLALYNTFHHWGAILVPPGYTDPAVFAAGGNPYGVSVTSRGDSELPPVAIAAAQHLAQRVIMITRWTALGREAEVAQSAAS
jgi:NAD(P)H dehydrogenase (quinone)